MDMEGDCKSPDALHDGNLCVSMSCTGMRISEYITATDSTPSLSSTEIGVTPAADCERSASLGVSLRIERLMQMRSEYASAVEFEIDASKDHWSELDNPTSDEDENETDSEIFRSLQEKWGNFFRDSSDRLVVGEKIAEGGQAEIFRAGYTSHKDWKFVLKVFKEGYSLRDLQKQMPLGMLQNRPPLRYWTGNACSISGGTLLKNGRFAFQMMKYWGDLRKLIDLRMQHNQNQCPLFTSLEVRKIVEGIALGMQELHEHNIIHRDLKASNVLIWDFDSKTFDPLHDSFACDVADFECSVGVVGTGYWRAPEILHAVQTHDIKSHIFTEKSDVYSFAMTCYEVLTGCTPFEDLGGMSYEIVIKGRRPKAPKHINPLLKTLLNKCWHVNPLERPSFQDVLNILSFKIFYSICTLKSSK